MNHARNQLASIFGPRTGARPAGVRSSRPPRSGVRWRDPVRGRVRIGLLLLGGLLFASGSHGPAGAGSLWSDESVNLFSNHKAMHVGDIVTVIIVESSSASNQSQTKLTKETTNDLTGSGSGELDFIKLFSASMDYSKEHQGKGQTTLSGSMKAQLTAEIIEIRPNGNLVVEGSRMVQINEDVDEITLRGVIRPEDIAADNTVLSTFLSEAQIAYTGSGPNKNAGRQGLISRILDLIF